MSSPSGRSEGNGTNRYDKRVSTNTKVFRDLTTKLSSNVQEEYIDAANKLAKWLGSEKAYYKEARPQIVTMLETASYTLARLLGLRLAIDLHISRCTPDLQPRTAAYTALVQTVKPYLPIFLEDHLKTRLVNIFSTIYVSPQASQHNSVTSADPTKRPTIAEGGTTIASPSGVSSTTVTPTKPALRVSVSSSSTRQEGSLSQSTHIDERGDKSATQRGSLMASQVPPPKESFSRSKSNSPAASLPDSPMTLQSVGTLASGSPAPHSGWTPINKPFLSRKAIFSGSVTDPEDAQATTVSAETQSIRSGDPPAAFSPSLPPHPHPESTPLTNSHTTSALSQPIDQVPVQQSLSPPVEIPSPSPTTSISTSTPPPVKRQSFSSAKFELLAALDKKSWKRTAQPGATSHEQGKGKKNDDNNGESGKVAKDSVTVASPAERTSLGSTVHMTQEQPKAFPNAGSAPEMTTMPHQYPITPVGSSGDTPPTDQISVASSEVVEQVAVQTPEPTQYMVPHVRERNPPESTGNDTGRDIPTSELPAEMPSSSPPPLSHALNHKVPTPDNYRISQQKEAVPRHIVLADAEEMGISSADEIGCQSNVLSLKTPSEMDMSLGPDTQIQTDQGASRQTEEAGGASTLAVQEVEQLSNPGVEIQSDSSVTTSPPVAEKPLVDAQKVSHVNETAQHQIGSNDETVSYGEGAKGLAVTIAPSESIASPNGASAVDVGPARPSLLRQTSQGDQTSISQNDDKPAMACAASYVPTIGVDAILSDSKRETMAVVAKHILKEYGNAEKPDCVDGMINHLSLQLDAVFPSGPDGAKLHAVLEARKQSLSGGQALSEQLEESNMRRTGDLPREVAGGSAAFGTTPLHKSLSETTSSGIKRARSSSSDNALSERPLNRARKEAGTGDGEKSPVAVTGAEYEVRAESPTDVQEYVAGTSADGALFPAVTKESTRMAGENEIAGNKESSQTQSDSTGKSLDAAGLSGSLSLPQAGSSTGHPSQVAVPKLPPLKPHSYHPSQPYEIISVVEGSPMAITQEIRFELDDEQLTLVKRWANRYDTFDETTRCMSFTLICTRLPDSRASGEGEEDTEETIEDMAIQWPSDGGCWITVETDDRPPVSIPLSPPHWIEGYEPLDLSSVVGEGTTKIRFIQTRDQSQYLFILRVHRPTEAQLHELDSTSLTGHMWTDTLACLTTPIPVDLKTGILSLPGGDHSSASAAL